MLGNVGGLIASWSFLPKDKPNYYIGNGLNLATSSLMLVIASVMAWWMKRDNRRRDVQHSSAELQGLSQAEIQELDWKHPTFRWKP